MKLNKPKFWDKQNNIISILLIPFALIYLFIIFIKKKSIEPVKFNIPIICVGNIYIGGTGKTPTSIFLYKEILKLGKNPAILKKFYKNHSDEHKLIKNKSESLILAENRVDGIKIAENSGHDCVILDDGFQDYKIHKNLNIICFNNNQQVGNGYVLPSGPLRESMSSLKNANIILINGKKDENFEKKIIKINNKLDIFYSKYKALNIEKFRDKNLLAIAAIGNPNNFFKLLEENDLVVKKKLIFPDHYVFNESEIKNIQKEAKDKNYKIIMTEKDYFKIKDFNNNMEYLEVELEIFSKKNFIDKVSKLYDQNN